MVVYKCKPVDYSKVVVYKCKLQITVKQWFTSVNQQFTLVNYLIPGLQLVLLITLLDTVEVTPFTFKYSL